MPPLSLLSNFGLAVGTMPTHRVMRVVRPAFGAEVSQFFFKSVGRQPEAQLQASRGILRRADKVISHPDCCFKRRGVTLGVARVVRAVALGAPSHRRAGTARPSPPLHGGAALNVHAVRGRAAAAQALSPCGVGPVRARRSATVVRAAPFVVRAARDAPRPLRLESGRRAAPLPARDECSFGYAPQPLTAECGKVKSAARARREPREFATHAARRFSIAETRADELLAELPPEVLTVATAGETGSQLPPEAAHALVRCALLVKGGPEGGTTRKGAD